MKKSRNRKSNIRNIEVKVKPQPLQPTGNESSVSESPSPEAPNWVDDYLQYKRSTGMFT
ncbi:hypothetical protein SCYZ1_32 [Pseudomonas phage SCYZ1]|nr:hypothetical protein SCYZ1_32 [Pseudomonas phage SCYZ1]